MQLLLLGMIEVPPEVVFYSRSCHVSGIQHHLAGVMCEVTRKCLDGFSSPHDICILSGSRRELTFIEPCYVLCMIHSPIKKGISHSSSLDWETKAGETKGPAQGDIGRS